MTRRVQRRGFTLLELLVVVMIVLVITGTGAVALTSKVPYMKLRAQASRVLDIIRMARERSQSEGRTYKVRIHQTITATYVEDLFLRDTGARYGNHQLVFSAPVQCWYRKGSSPLEISPTTAFPATLKPWPNFDGGQPSNLQWAPILMLSDYGQNPPGMEFPTSLATIKLSDAFELDPDIAIIRINGHKTYSNVPISPYCQIPFNEPIPTSPNWVTGTPPRPYVRTSGAPSYYYYDDRIADITYSPDQVFKFQPTPDLPVAPATPTQTFDMTITFATFEGAVKSLTENLAPPDVITITIDRRTGFPRL